MGNDLRAGSFAICFVEKGDVGVSLRATSNINERLDLNSPLVSMGNIV